MNTPSIFSERQRFTQWWLWLLLLGSNAFFLFGVFQQVINKQTFGDNPMSDTGLVISTGLMLLFTLAFAIIRLETDIREDGIYVRFFPYQRKHYKYAWTNIDKAFVRTYSPLGEYGGWGWRMGFSPSKGGAFNVSGNQGLQLVLTNGTKILIGTNKPQELKTALAAFSRERV